MARVGPSNDDAGRPLHQATGMRTRLARITGTTAEQNLILGSVGKSISLCGILVANPGAQGTLTLKYGSNATVGTATLLKLVCGGTVNTVFNFASVLGGGVGNPLPAGTHLSAAIDAGTPDILVEYILDTIAAR